MVRASGKMLEVSQTRSTLPVAEGRLLGQREAVLALHREVLGAGARSGCFLGDCRGSSSLKCPRCPCAVVLLWGCRETALRFDGICLLPM